MQPPLPGKPAPPVSLGTEPHQASVSTHPLQDLPDTASAGPAGGAAHVVGTRDTRLVRAWAEHQGAEPATGEATASGPATVFVNDQGSGLRFNFPGASRFRALTWDEWLAHFDAASLVFVFEMASPAGAQAESHFGGAFYRIVSAADWGDRALATVAPADDADPQIGRE